MSCPRCGFAEPGPVECPRCGVVFAKLERPARPPRLPSDPTPRGRRLSPLDVLLLVALVAAGVLVVVRWTRPQAPGPLPAATAARRVPLARAPHRPAPAPSSAPSSPAGTPEPAEGTAPPSTGPGIVEAPRPVILAGARGVALPSEEMAAYLSLMDAVVARAEMDSSRVAEAERLLERHPGVPELGRLAEGVLELAAQQASRRGQGVDAARLRERAAELQPESRGAWLRLVEGHMAASEWREAELAARRGLSALPGESQLHLALARALEQQARDEDAADVLRRRLAARADPAARAELDRLEKELASVAGYARRASAHFDVRYERQEDASLGTALLRVLEEKYSLLARTLGCEPDRTVPVTLLPDETFRTATSAPEWAGAFYSHADGRIRVRTGDLRAGFVPVDLERTLTHELAHAFIHARTRGAVPDDVNEGLAQYLSGRRLGYKLDLARAAVRDGRMKVDDFYDSALSFVEYLVDRYHQEALNDLLEAAGETGNVDQAFRRAFNQTYAETRAEWLRQLK